MKRLGLAACIGNNILVAEELGGHKYKWQDNIKMYFGEMGCTDSGYDRTFCFLYMLCIMH